MAHPPWRAALRYSEAADATTLPLRTVRAKCLQCNDLVHRYLAENRPESAEYRRFHASNRRFATSKRRFEASKRSSMVFKTTILSIKTTIGSFNTTIPSFKTSTCCLQDDDWKLQHDDSKLQAGDSMLQRDAKMAGSYRPGCRSMTTSQPETERPLPRVSGRSSRGEGRGAADAGRRLAGDVLRSPGVS